MAIKWTTASKGVRYKEHASRKHGKRFDRYFVLQYRRGAKVLNEPVGWSSDGVTQSDCERILHALRENWRLGTGPQTLAEMRTSNLEEAAAAKEQEKHEQALTLQSIFEGGYLAAQVEKKPTSIIGEKTHMRLHVVPFFGAIPLKQITPQRMDEFLAHMRGKTSERTGRPLSAATIRYALATIRQIWHYALSRNIIELPFPAKSVKAPVGDNRRTRFLTRDEADLLLTTLKSRSPETHDLALTSLYTGLRCGELFNLQWQDVNFTEGFIHVRDRKNKESGLAWLSPPVENMLRVRFAGQKGTDFVFPNGDGAGQKFISKTFSRVVAELFNEGVSDPRGKIVFHSLRHTYASWLAQKGVPLHTLAGLMGHKTVAMTERYSHLSPHGMKAAAMLIHEE